MPIQWITNICDADKAAQCEIMQKVRQNVTIDDCIDAYEEANRCIRKGGAR